MYNVCTYINVLLWYVYIYIYIQLIEHLVYSCTYILQCTVMIYKHYTYINTNAHIYSSTCKLILTQLKKHGCLLPSTFWPPDYPPQEVKVFHNALLSDMSGENNIASSTMADFGCWYLGRVGTVLNCHELPGGAAAEGPLPRRVVMEELPRFKWLYRNTWWWYSVLFFPFQKMQKIEIINVSQQHLPTGWCLLICIPLKPGRVIDTLEKRLADPGWGLEGAMLVPGSSRS